MKASAILLIVFILFSMAVTTFEKKTRAQNYLRMNKNQMCRNDKECPKGYKCLKSNSSTGNCRKRN